jgi:hypothetical protein
MTWQYHQKSGVLFQDGKLLTSGYSGHDAGFNNPALESDVGIGPIPRGMWTIGAFGNGHPHLGPLVAALTPKGHDAHGRSAFFIHGDNAKADHSASHGCIILPRFAREAIARSGDTALEVVA